MQQFDKLVFVNTWIFCLSLKGGKNIIYILS